MTVATNQAFLLDTKIDAARKRFKVLWEVKDKIG